MRINAAGLKLIKSFEGCQLTAYKCPAGVWSLGWGSTGVGIKEGVIWTQAEADERLLRDLAIFEGGVENLTVGIQLTLNQFSALVSFAYNLGLKALAGSTLLRKINSDQPHTAALEFLKWDKAGGKHLAGLTKRRLAEMELFLS